MGILYSILFVCLFKLDMMYPLPYFFLFKKEYIILLYIFMLYLNISPVAILAYSLLLILKNQIEGG